MPGVLHTGDMTGAAPLPPFANEPTLELRRAPERESLLGALAELDTRLPRKVPVLGGGDAGGTDDFASTDPGRPDRVVRYSGRASPADA